MHVLMNRLTITVSVTKVSHHRPYISFIENLTVLLVAKLLSLLLILSMQRVLSIEHITPMSNHQRARPVLPALKQLAHLRVPHPYTVTLLSKKQLLPILVLYHGKRRIHVPNRRILSLVITAMIFKIRSLMPWTREGRKRL